MKVCLDLHDFSISNSRLYFLLGLKNHFPHLKVSLFVLPDHSEDYGPFLLRNKKLELIKANQDWLQFIPHGLTHSSVGYKFRSYKGFKREMPQMVQMIENDDLSCERGFCAPHWRWNENVVKALDEEGWWGAIHRDNLMVRPKKFYCYSHLLNEKWDPGLEVLKLHGHIYGTDNDIGLCFWNLVDNIPKDAEWHFVTDFISTKDEAI